MSSSLDSAALLDFTPRARLHPSPEDWRDQVIYFLIVDRFDNGADAPAFGQALAQNADVNTRKQFQGGKLRGVTRRLDYIRGLGCTAIWLSPIFKNRLDLSDTYHGYGIQDFLDVDPRFGTLADLQELTREAHARDMYVIADIVLNHTGDVWAYPGDQPYFYFNGEQFPFGEWREVDATPGLQSDDAVHPIELQSPGAFKRRGQIRNWSNAEEIRDGDFFGLKELDLPREDVLDTLIKVYKHWVEIADLDGFRVDTVKHMENSATAIFCNAIREYAQRLGKHRFFLFGEIAAGDEVIQQYLGRNARIEGTNERFPSLDAALDFPLAYELEPVIKGFNSPARLRARYDALRDAYADHGEAGRYFVTFFENHDRNRRFLNGDRFSRQAILASAYLLTSQGVPCLYYGTEQGFDGGGDDDSYVRQCMFGGTWGAFGTAGVQFFNPKHEIYLGIKQVAQVRALQPALRYGRQYFRETSVNGLNFSYPNDGCCTLAYSRILDTEEVLVALNLTSVERTECVTVDRKLSAPHHAMRDLLDPSRKLLVEQAPDARAFVRVTLPGHGLAILKAG